MTDVLLQFLEAELLLSSLPDVDFYVRCQCSDGACIVSGINQLLLISFYGHGDLGLGAAWPLLLPFFLLRESLS